MFLESLRPSPGKLDPFFGHWVLLQIAPLDSEFEDQLHYNKNGANCCWSQSLWVAIGTEERAQPLLNRCPHFGTFKLNYVVFLPSRRNISSKDPLVGFRATIGHLRRFVLYSPRGTSRQGFSTSSTYRPTSPRIVVLRSNRTSRFAASLRCSEARSASALVGRSSRVPTMTLRRTLLSLLRSEKR